MTKKTETWQIADVQRNMTDTTPLTGESLYILKIKRPDGLTASTIGVTYAQVNALMHYFGAQDENDLINREFTSDSVVPYEAWILLYSTVLQTS